MVKLPPLWCLVFVSFLLSQQVLCDDRWLSLNDTIAIAASHDPWLAANTQRQQGLREQAVASHALPDPRLSLSMMNLPTDGFAFNQEPMTQFFVGLSQSLPRGDTLAIKSTQLALTAEQLEHSRQDRLLKLKQVISERWLTARFAKVSLEQLSETQQLLDTFLQARTSGYSTSSGTLQSDLLNAQLRLLDLQDRQTQFFQQYDTAVTQLYEWLPQSPENWRLDFSKEVDLPSVTYSADQLIQWETLTSLLQQHPAVLAMHDKQRHAQQGISLAKQAYSPEWQISAGYAARADTPEGQSRADFFTLGVSVDLPFFTHNRQDRQLSAAVHEAEAVRSDTQQLVRQMATNVQTLLTRMKHLDTRIALYQDTWLPLTQQQIATLNAAYASDASQVFKTLDAQINQVEKQLGLLALQHEQQVVLTQLHYLLSGSRQADPTVDKE